VIRILNNEKSKFLSIIYQPYQHPIIINKKSFKKEKKNIIIISIVENPKIWKKKN